MYPIRPKNRPSKIPELPFPKPRGVAAKVVQLLEVLLERTEAEKVGDPDPSKNYLSYPKTPDPSYGFPPDPPFMTPLGP